MNYVYLIASILLGYICLMGIISNKFHDNLFQRIALSGMVLSCVGFISQTLQDLEPDDFEIFMLSTSLYAIATTWKLRDGRDKANT